MTGHVLSVERLSVHDGPGLRTTVFLKGCPLRCRWCHNPESVSPQPELALLQGKCLGCRRCETVCPAGAHSFSAAGHSVDRSRCRLCGACVEACLPGALRTYGREMSVDETVVAVLEDRTFYETSGGGCTLSGGEPLLQADFCKQVQSVLHEEGVHCAVDTSGLVPWEAFETVLPSTDLFLYDVKHIDEGVHREHTGLSNTLIVENLQRLGRKGTPIEVRIPLIPGFNTDAGALAGIGQMLRGVAALTGVRLLPYHRARAKYEALGRPEPMPEVPLPTADQVLEARQALENAGVRVLPQ